MGRKKEHPYSETSAAKAKRAAANKQKIRRVSFLNFSTFH